jgi:4-hydroxy-tetrahydrodipicolinate reductase
MARAFRGHSEFSASIEEEHHQFKLDAPSGTALQLQTRLRAEDQHSNFPISSTRVGDALGTHVLSYKGPYETVTLSHVTQSRKTFAVGAISAAEWLPGHVGVFTFEQMLFGPS